MISQRTQAFTLRPLGPLPPQANSTPVPSQEARKGDVELNTASKKVLETWFPARQALVTQRGGSGRQTSSRMLNLELRCEGRCCGFCTDRSTHKNVRYCGRSSQGCLLSRISSEMPASPAQPSPMPQLGLITPGRDTDSRPLVDTTINAACSSSEY